MMANIDPNLLILFKYLWEERSSTKVAKRLFITQSAVSQALARLRNAFGDDLFVRIPGGLSPTPRAIILSQSINEVVTQIEAISSVVKPFDIGNETSTFTVASTDYFERLALVPMVEMLTSKAPKARMRTTLLSGELPTSLLQNGTVDCAVAGYFKNIPEGFYKRTLFQDDFSGMCRKDHPILKGKLTAKKYCQYPHLMVSIRGDFHGLIDERLPEGLKRHVSYTSPSFLSLPHSLTSSDAVVSMPTRLAKLAAQGSELTLFKIPVASPTISVDMVWHRRVHTDPFQQYMRESMAAVFVK
jgi:DNA-binding transcriptional LysR family regulator